jgi:hypothetical protein
VVDDDRAIDVEFERTQPIGNAINALAQAELAVAGVDDLPPEITAQIERAVRSITAAD